MNELRLRNLSCELPLHVRIDTGKLVQILQRDFDIVVIVPGAAIGIELYLSVLELLFPVVGVKIDIQYSSPDLHGAKLYLYLSTGLIVLRHSVQCLVLWLEHHCALSGTVVDE